MSLDLTQFEGHSEEPLARFLRFFNEGSVYPEMDKDRNILADAPQSY